MKPPKIISPETTPERFFLPRVAGSQSIFDDNGVVVDTQDIIKYDVETETTYGMDAEGNLYMEKRRKSKLGIQALRAFPDHAELWHYVDGEEIHVSTAWIYAQRMDWEKDDWEHIRFEGVEPVVEDNGESFKYSYSRDHYTWAIEANWRLFNAKQTYHIEALGELLRVQGIIEIFDAEALIVNYDDFKGVDIIDDQTTGNVRVLTFASDGVYDELTVDPYLSVEEETTYIDVHCDGFIFRINNGTTNTPYHGYILDPSETELIRLVSRIYSGGSSSFFGYHARSIEILENTPARVVIRMVGNFATTYNGSGRTGLDQCVQTYYIYPDKVAVDVQLDVNSNELILDNASTFNYLVGWFGSPSNLTSETNIRENGGSETSGSFYAQYLTADYLGAKSDEINWQTMTQAIVGFSGYTEIKYLGTHGYSQFGVHNVTLGEGTHVFSTLSVFDSADRDHGSKKYSSTNRLTMGDQYNDISASTDPTVNTGSEVTDLNIPDMIGSTILASDGSYQVTSDGSNVSKLTFNQAEIGSNLIIRDPQFLTGTVGSETDLLLGHWKCNDNAANTTIADSSGNGNNGTLGGGDNTADKDSSESIRGTSLLLNGVDDYLDLSAGVADLTDDDKFTILLRFKPNFAYNTGDSQCLFSIGSSATNRFQFYYYENTDQWALYNDINDIGERTELGTAYASNRKLQQWHNLMVCVDLSRDFIQIWLDGKVLHTFYNIDDSWSATVDFLMIGRSADTGTLYGAYYIDEVKLLDGCVMPYGANFTGNGTVDTSVAHEDVLFHWQGEDCRSTDVDIGGVQGTLGSGNTPANAFQTTGGLGNETTYFDNESNGSNHYLRFPITSQNIVSLSGGKMVIWASYESITNYDFLACIYGDDDNDYLGFHVRADGTMRIRGRCNGTAFDEESTLTISTGEKHCFKLVWGNLLASGAVVTLYVDDIEFVSVTTTTAWNNSTYPPIYLYLGALFTNYSADVHIHQVTITDSPDTPEIWTNNGTPLHMPTREVT